MLFLGLYDYGLPPHMGTAKWTSEIVGELKRSCGWENRRRKFHDFSNWKANGVQIIRECEGIHTFNILRYIRYERQDPMAVVLFGSWVIKQFRPAIEDAPDHILVRYMSQAGNSGRGSLPRIYGSNLFVEIADHLGRNKDMWRIN